MPRPALVIWRLTFANTRMRKCLWESMKRPLFAGFFYAFTCVGGSELFVLSDRRRARCFHSQHTLRRYFPFIIPAASSPLFILFTLPRLSAWFHSAICFPVFHQLQCDTQLEFISTEASGVRRWFFVRCRLVSVLVHVCTLQIPTNDTPSCVADYFLLSSIYFYLI